MKKHVAAGLADALLAGPPDLESGLARCREALGAGPPWLRPLVRNVLPRFSDRWHWGSRNDLIDAIQDCQFFRHGWLSQPAPRIRHYFLGPLKMAPRPLFLDCAVPDLPTPAALAEWLGLEPARLEGIVRSLLYREANEPARVWHYRYRWVAKRSGGYRLLEIPKNRLRALQRRILSGLLEYVPPHETAHGFRTGRSCLTHAREHVGQSVVIRLDLEDFFLNVGAARIRRVFDSLGYPDETARWLTALCTNRVPAEFLRGVDHSGFPAESHRPDWQAVQRYRTPHLPQGAPTSPALANLCAFPLDLRLQALADALDARYTRYADDLTFSGGDGLRRAAERFIPMVGAVAVNEGFGINFRKTRVLTQAMRQRVAGVVVNAKPNVARAEYDRIKAILHNCLKFGPKTQSGLPPASFRQHLAGHVAQIHALNPERADRLRRMLEAIRWGE